MTNNITSKSEAIEIVTDYARNVEIGILVQTKQQKDGLTASEIVLQELYSFGWGNMPEKFLYAIAERLTTEAGDQVGIVKPIQ